VNLAVSSLLERTALGAALGALSGQLVVATGLASAVSYSRPRALLLVGFAAAGALVTFTRARKPACLVPALLAAFWLVAAFTPLSSALAAATLREDPEGPADVAFVFSSDIRPDGTPDTDYMTRLFHAVELVAQGRANVLAVSEVHGGNLSEEVARHWLGELHVSAEVLSVGLIANTHEEAVLLARRARERGWTRVLAVTSPVHERRACETLEHEGLTAVASPAMQTTFDALNPGGPDGRMTSMGPVLHEVVGEWVYRRRGWIK
jgi:uncharacterized SAM-binding protein YcdF (DUF218 family)